MAHGRPEGTVTFLFTDIEDATLRAVDHRGGDLPLQMSWAGVFLDLPSGSTRQRPASVDRGAG